MWWLAHIEQLQEIAPASYAAIRCRRASSAKAEQRLEGGHRLLSPIMPKDELIKVDLELGAAHAEISADQPLLQVSDGAIGERYHRFCALPQVDPQRLRAGDMPEPGLLQACESLEAIRVNRRARRYVLPDEAVQGGRFESGITVMRRRPEALLRFSTATKTSAARRPLSCRLPRSPA